VTLHAILSPSWNAQHFSNSRRTTARKFRDSTRIRDALKTLTWHLYAYNEGNEKHDSDNKITLAYAFDCRRRSPERVFFPVIEWGWSRGTDFYRTILESILSREQRKRYDPVSTTTTRNPRTHARHQPVRTDTRRLPERRLTIMMWSSSLVRGAAGARSRITHFSHTLAEQWRAGARSARYLPCRADFLRIPRWGDRWWGA